MRKQRILKQTVYLKSLRHQEETRKMMVFLVFYYLALFYLLLYVWVYFQFCCLVQGIEIDRIFPSNIRDFLLVACWYTIHSSLKQALSFFDSSSSEIQLRKVLPILRISLSRIMNPYLSMREVYETIRMKRFILMRMKSSFFIVS